MMIINAVFGEQIVIYICNTLHKVASTTYLEFFLKMYLYLNVMCESLLLLLIHFLVTLYPVMY